MHLLEHASSPLNCRVWEIGVIKKLMMKMYMLIMKIMKRMMTVRKIKMKKRGVTLFSPVSLMK